MLKRAILIITTVSAIVLGILLYTTTPASTGPFGILAFFVFMYLTALGVLTFLLRGISLVIPKFSLVPHKRLKMRELSFKMAYYYASVIALVPVMLIAMQSVGEIGIYQIFLVLFFVVIAWLYIANRTI